MAKQIGNPRVVIRTGRTQSFRKIASSERSYLVRASSKDDVRSVLAEGILKEFYKKNLSQSALSINERRLKMRELIPMDQEIFIATGMNRLQGKKASTRMLDDWWKVRMGMPLHRSHSHQLFITNMHWDKGEGKKESLGHFCFGIRKRGGDTAKDVIFDFRAPWDHDRRARFTEALNLHNRLKLEGMTLNLYDWFYTQTERRNCYVNLWFLPIFEEQLSLLHDFSARDEWHRAGNFRVGKKNCASLGGHFLNLILPIGEKIKGRDNIFDYPVQTRQAVVDRFSKNSILIELTNMTQKLGHTPTNKSALQPALPSRKGSRPYRFLLKNPRIN